MFSTPFAAVAAEPPAAQAAAVQAMSVTLVNGNVEATYSTRAQTVGAFLQELNVAVAPGDYVSLPLDTQLGEGTRIAYRPAVQIELRTGAVRTEVRTAAPTVAAFLAERAVALTSDDEITPALDAPLNAGSIVRIVHVSRITTTSVGTIPPPLKRRWDSKLALGETRVLDAGLPGLRETTVRVERRDDGTPARTFSASRVVREPRARIVAVGASPQLHEFVDVARAGFGAALRLADRALSMMATAYTAGCYGCSGVTATGFRAGHGIVAVDPNVIPLGTKLYVPGYGRAVAGDTGGDIHGRRIDLGFDSLAEAMRFGRREITVYVLH
jgi:3D (Asp-Asp-Asp) domain-containing protein